MDWFWTLLIMCIPIVGTIMVFVWAFGSGSDSRKNFARAILLWYVVAIAIGIIFGIITAALTCSALSFY